MLLVMMPGPVIGLLPQQIHKLQQIRVAIAIIEPECYFHLVAGAGLAPFVQRTPRQIQAHVTEIIAQDIGTRASPVAS